MTKVLAICQAGTIRSGALSHLLKYAYGVDALSASAEETPDTTMSILADWADYIVLLEPHFAVRIPPEFHAKVRVFDVGPDRWSNPLHPELLAIVKRQNFAKPLAIAG